MSNIPEISASTKTRSIDVEFVLGVAVKKFDKRVKRVELMTTTITDPSKNASRLRSLSKGYFVSVTLLKKL